MFTTEIRMPSRIHLATCWSNISRTNSPRATLARWGIGDGKGLASKLFTERKVFQEVVRASEGVARDLINIFSKAYFVAHRKGRDQIERDAVLEAARQWFERDKERNLDEELRTVPLPPR